jgi:hypothetical protein
LTTEEELKADIAATRAELAETADVLAARLSAKAEVGKRVGAALAGTVLVVVLVRRIRRARARRSAG